MVYGILKSERGDNINYIINISYYMNNHYQIILDKMKDPLSLEIIIYSKENKFSQLKIGKKMILKDYEDNCIYNLKRYGVINISKQDFYKMYNNKCFNKITNETKIYLEKKNSLFVNFIIKNDNKCEGRIFEQKVEQGYKDFTKKEIKLLKSIKLLQHYSNF